MAHHHFPIVAHIAVALAGCAAMLPVDAAPAIATTAEQASRAMDAAIVGGDAATLDRLIAPDFLWVRSGGRRTDKADFVRSLAAPGLKIDPYTPADNRWFRSGDLAIHTATNDMHGREDGKAFTDRHSFVDVWRHDAAGWRLVYTQVTKAPDPAR